MSLKYLNRNLLHVALSQVSVSGVIAMALLQYFKLKILVLPDPNGSLARVVPFSSITATNEAVKNAILKMADTSSDTSKASKASLKG